MSTSFTHVEDILLHIQRRLDDLDRKADDLNRKLDLLFTRSNTDPALGYHGIPPAGNTGWDTPGLDVFASSSTSSLLE